MVSRDENLYVIWPVYFDKNVSRDQGRKVPKKNAVEKPTVDMIAKAAKSLGLKPKLEKNASYPGRFWKNEGRILVEKKDSKQKILNQIANRL
jgi:signal recognition particle subunit SRP19